MILCYVKDIIDLNALLITYTVKLKNRQILILKSQIFLFIYLTILIYTN